MMPPTIPYLVGSFTCTRRANRFILIILVLFCAPLQHHIANAEDVHGNYETDEGYLVEWKIVKDTFTMKLNVASSTVSWIALGISSSTSGNAMFGADAVMGFAGKDSTAVHRMRLGTSTGDVIPADHGLTKNADISQSAVDHSWTLTFSRPLASQSSSETTIDPNRPITIIAAWRDAPNEITDATSVGVHTGRYKKVVNKDTGSVVQSSAHQASNSNGEISLGDNILMKYSIDATTITISATLLSRRAWIGIGLSQKLNSMIGSWAVIGTPANSDVNAYMLGSKSMPSVDADMSSMLSATSCEYVGQNTILTFTRALKLNSNRAYDVNSAGQGKLIWAHGSDDVISQHDARGSVLIDWSKGSGESADADSSLRKAHGSFMFIAWMVMVPTAVIIARFFKDDQGKWFRYHRALMVGSVFLSSTSFLMIVSSIDAGRNFASLHGVIGLIVQLMVVVHPILAIFRNRFRAIWEKQHRWTGALMYTLSTVNCFLGAKLLSSANSKSTFTGFVVMAFIMAMGTFIILQVKKGRSVAHPTAHNDLAEEERERVHLDQTPESRDSGMDLSRAQQPWPR